MSTPRRTCLGCRQDDEQSALERFVLVDGVVVADPARRLPGRGAWLHPDDRCREAALRRGGFARGFRRRVEVPEDLFEACRPAGPAATGSTAGVASR
ncbi:YlxR family protein [Luteococcus peritonei]|uniref:YlxR family protein n=1 Tax=Luteococcus peritonei TaxID=88874 RepID=A0ABW4RYI0_9ACTN